MKLSIRTRLDYRLEQPTDILVQVEAAALPEQLIASAKLDVGATRHFARVHGHDHIGERIWVRAEGRFSLAYDTSVEITRLPIDCRSLDIVPPHRLPGETIEYLLPSRYCHSDQFETFVEAEFGRFEGGAKVVAMRDWITRKFAYVSGSSNSDTTALETFIKRQGICRDFAHVLITLVRAAGIPARFASVYALGVEPQDFHAVAEVFLGGEWHLLDATGMATAASMVKIGVGRDAADVAFLTAYGSLRMDAQSVCVTAA